MECPAQTLIKNTCTGWGDVHYQSLTAGAFDNQGVGLQLLYALDGLKVYLTTVSPNKVVSLTKKVSIVDGDKQLAIGRRGPEKNKGFKVTHPKPNVWEVEVGRVTIAVTQNGPQRGPHAWWNLDVAIRGEWCPAALGKGKGHCFSRNNHRIENIADIKWKSDEQKAAAYKACDATEMIKRHPALLFGCLEDASQVDSERLMSRIAHDANSVLRGRRALKKLDALVGIRFAAHHAARAADKARRQAKKMLLKAVLDARHARVKELVAKGMSPHKAQALAAAQHPDPDSDDDSSASSSSKSEKASSSASASD